MTSDSYTEKAKLFLERQMKEYQLNIKKLKKKKKIIKALYISFIVVSVTSSTICAAAAGFTLPPTIIFILSVTAGLTTTLSVKFNLEGQKAELNKTIDHLDKTKRKIDYVVSCNGNFTEAEYRQIIGEVFS